MSETRHVWKPWRANTRTAASRMIRRLSTLGFVAAISASSRGSWPSRAVAGAAWQGRRPAGIPQGFQGSRTPPGGDRRPSISGGPSREGALEEPAGRGRPGRRRTVLVGAVARVDLEPDAVRVGEEEPARPGAVGVRDDPAVLDAAAQLAHALLRRLDRLDRVDLEREVVQAGAVGIERAL